MLSQSRIWPVIREMLQVWHHWINSRTNPSRLLGLVPTSCLDGASPWCCPSELEHVFHTASSGISSRHGKQSPARDSWCGEQHDLLIRCSLLARDRTPPPSIIGCIHHEDVGGDWRPVRDSLGDWFSLRPPPPPKKNKKTEKTGPLEMAELSSWLAD